MVQPAQHPVRRCLVATIVALALAGCAVPASSPRSPLPPSAASSPVPSGESTGSIVPWVDVTPTPVPSPTPIPIPPGTPICAPSDLTATAGWQGATGSMAGGVTVTNMGSYPCVLDGPPRLIQLRSGTTILRPITYHAEQRAGPGDSAGPAGPVLLRPRDQAAAFLIWDNWCPRKPAAVTAVLVTLPDGGHAITAGPASPGPGIDGTPRCDQPTAASTLDAFAFAPVPAPEPPYEPAAASVSLSVPPTTTPGASLAFLVSLTNRGSKPAVMSPCPTYTEDLIVAGRALKPPAPQQFLLNCAAIGPTLAPGASVTFQMRYAIPSSVAPGPVDLVWGMDPGGPFDASTAIERASLSIVAP